MPAADDADRRGPVVSISDDPTAAVPRLRIVLAGDISGDAVVDAFIKLYAERPEAALSDRLFDLTGYQSGFDHRHLQRIAPAYRAAEPDPRHPSRTAFVTRDPNFGLWTKAMAHQFAGRSLRAFGTVDEAEAFLDVPLTERAAQAGTRNGPAGGDGAA